MKVSVSNGIQISVDAETWKTYIDNNDIISSAYVGNANQIPTKMNAVSSAGEVDLSTGFMKIFKSFHEIDSSIESGYRIESQRTIEPLKDISVFPAEEFLLDKLQIDSVNNPLNDSIKGISHHNCVF